MGQWKFMVMTSGPLGSVMQLWRPKANCYLWSAVDNEGKRRVVWLNGQVLWVCMKAFPSYCVRHELYFLSLARKSHSHFEIPSSSPNARQQKKNQFAGVHLWNVVHPFPFCVLEYLNDKFPCGFAWSWQHWLTSVGIFLFSFQVSVCNKRRVARHKDATNHILWATKHDKLVYLFGDWLKAVIPSSADSTRGRGISWFFLK